MTGPEELHAVRFQRALWVGVAALTAARVLGLVLSPVQLHGDEAQYWNWSHEFAWGYFSKPPLIAWAIAATTGLFGDGEAAVRLAAPFTHAFGAVCLGLLGRDMFGPRIGFWSGAVYIVMPGIWLSSAVISTDALLLPVWSFALLALRRFVDRGGWGWAAALGVGIGVGFLAKYATIYFVVGLAILVALDPAVRRRIFSLPGALAAVIAVALLSPNLAWNAAHEFQTVSHTAANANWSGPNFRPMKLLEFWGAQFGVFGPLTLVMLLAAVFGWPRLDPEARAKARFLIAFVLPAFVVVSAQAFINRANANWAACMYPASCVLVAFWASEGRRLALPRLGGVRLSSRWLAVAVAMHVGFGAVFAAAGLAPTFADSIGAANAFKRTRSWDDTAHAVRAAYERGHDGDVYAIVAVDNRLLFHGLEYYGREDPLPLRMWLRYADAKSHAEARAPLTTDDAGPVLIVNEREGELERIRGDFERLVRVGEADIDLGGGKARTLEFFAGYGFAPVPRDAAYELRWSPAG